MFDQMVIRLEYTQYDDDKTEFLMEYKRAADFTGVFGVFILTAQTNSTPKKQLLGCF